MRSYDLSELLNRRLGSGAKPADDLETLTRLKAEAEGDLSRAQIENGNAALAHAQGNGSERAVRETARAVQDAEQRLRGIEAGIEQLHARKAEAERQERAASAAAKVKGAVNQVAEYVAAVSELQLSLERAVRDYETAALLEFPCVQTLNALLPAKHVPPLNVGAEIAVELLRLASAPDKILFPGAAPYGCGLDSADLTSLAANARAFQDRITAVLESAGKMRAAA